jgi:high affinity Mn2+ porin
MNSYRATPLFALALLLVCFVDLSAQSTTLDEPPGTDSRATLLLHPDTSWWWLSGQLNMIFQAHRTFPSPYDGAHSFRSEDEHALSRVWTIHAGARHENTDVLVDIESAGGRGVSDALGLAGFTNLDVVRNPDLGSAPYLARLIVHRTFALSDDPVHVDRGPFALSPTVTSRRIDVRAGKMSVADFFDVNASGSDSHLQFMNWTVDNNGAFDYAADTRGYTWGVMAAIETPRWTLRAGEMLMPKVANGIDLDWHLGRARGENLEVEIRPGSRLVVRGLVFTNKANLGSYHEAIDAFASGRDPAPDIDAHRQRGRREYGVGLNAEDTLRDVRVFARTGWNDGRNESFAYTEVNDSALFGGDVIGHAWRRSDDRVGIAFVSNGLSDVHREYLRRGGRGFLLGDGNLHYRREDIVETYYTARLWRGVSASFDLQHVVHPGYNEDRGPVTVAGARLHVEF